MSDPKKKTTADEAKPVAIPAAAPAPANVPASPLMYVGPPLRTPFPVATGTPFPNGLPVPLQAAVDADADLKALFVPLAQAGAALRQLEKGAGDLVKPAKTVAKQYARRKQ